MIHRKIDIDSCNLQYSKYLIEAVSGGEENWAPREMIVS